MACTALTMFGAHAADDAKPWPTAKPITWMVGFPPGGTLDVLTRVAARKLAENLGILDFTLSEAEMAEIAKLKRPDSRIVSPPLVNLASLARPVCGQRIGEADTRRRPLNRDGTRLARGTESNSFVCSMMMNSIG